MTSESNPEEVPLRALEVKEEPEDDPSDYLCGVGSWTPTWLQRFANIKSFMAVYGTLGTVQAMGFVYFISSLTTIEKRFGIQSKTTGWMLSGNEVSQILLSLVLSFYGGQKNRPVWLAIGVACSAFSCFVLATPHFLYGSGHKALALTEEYEEELKHINTSVPVRNDAGLCNRGTREIKECPYESEDSMAALCIFLSQFILGIGSTLYFSLGQPYIDDNIKKKTNTPVLLGTTMGVRMIGTVVSFALVYTCLSLYINPTLTPTISQDDPRWLGAWWLGWVILGGTMLFLSSILIFFPKKLKKKNLEEILDKEEGEEEKGDEKKGEETKVETTNGILKTNTNSNGAANFYIGEKKKKEEDEFFPSLMRLLKNKVLIANILSSCFYVLGGSGFMTYMTKIMEVQFYRTAANANVIIGPLILASMVLGCVGSGYCISKFKPRPVYLLGWNVVVGSVYVASQLSYVYVNCPDINIVGYNIQSRSFNLMNECNSGCGCEEVAFTPVYMKEGGLTFYSPCHAGCMASIKSGTFNAYGNCTCIPSASPIPSNSSTGSMFETSTEILQYGYAPVGCALMYTLYTVMSVFKNFLGATGRIGNILVTHRCVAVKDKSFAQGLNLFLISLLAFVPGPIIFGYIIDGTCLIWDKSCGKVGNCTFYDRGSFNFWVNVISACFTGTGVMFDALVCYFGRNLDLYGEEDPGTKNKEKNP